MVNIRNLINKLISIVILRLPLYVNETHAPMSVMSTQANPPPGAWAHSQRQMKKANRFARKRINKLNAIDFDWTWIGSKGKRFDWEKKDGKQHEK